MLIESSNLTVNTPNVLAVVVIHECEIDEIAAWPMLGSWAEARANECALSIDSVLIYDNSSLPRADSSSVPDWAIYVHDPSNGGTAAAYSQASWIAEARDLPWILLLDDDTSLPGDLLTCAGSALAAHATSNSNRKPAAILPYVRQGVTPVSPAYLTRLGGICPIPLGVAIDSSRKLTGIASGTLLHRVAFCSIGPIPTGLWLDYLDHWIFAQLQQMNWTVIISSAVLDHDLSVNQPSRISARRLRSILDGERIYAASLGVPAQLLSRLRVLWRALGPSRLTFAQRRIVLQNVLGCAKSHR